MKDEAMVERRWRLDTAHGRASWPGVLTRELVAAYRRGSMDAARCLGTYRLHGDRALLPPEAVVYLATRVLASRDPDGAPERPVWDRYDGHSTSEWLAEQGESELAALAVFADDEFDDLVEAGRLFFFPGPLGRG